MVVSQVLHSAGLNTILQLWCSHYAWKSICTQMVLSLLQIMKSASPFKQFPLKSQTNAAKLMMNGGIIIQTFNLPLHIILTFVLQGIPFTNITV
jgi:hypothetical protein